MNPCLNAMEARLTDLLHTGLDTGAVDSAADFRRLAEPLLEAIFQAEHYITLCRERWQEIEILNRWQRNRQDQDREGGDFT